MAKVKETKVAIRGEDPKKAPKASKTARKVPPHHEEVKAGSDSSSSNSDSSSGSESDSDAEKRKNTKKPKVSRAKETEPASPPVADDSSEDDDSSDEDSSEGEVMKAVKAAKAKKAATPATVTANGAVKKSTKSSKSKETVSSSSDSDSGDEGSADEGAAKPTAYAEDSDEEMGDAPAVASAPEPVDPTKATAPQPFNPPPGYRPLDTKKASSRTLSALLSNPGQKQIWHITAPSSVPLSQIQSISLASIQNQTPILSHNNTNYTLAEEKESKTTKKVLIPGDKGYAASEVPVSRSLVLQQVISLPNLPKHQESTAPPQSVLQRGKREPRPQPKGLRMRYKPLGYGAGTPGAVLGADESGDSDVDMDSAPAFHVPSSGDKESEKEKKRKRDAEEAAATPRTEKKRRKEKENSSGKKKKIIGADDADKDEVEILAGKEDEVKRAEDALVEGTLKEGPQSIEQIARRKAEKKERKSKEKKARN